MHATTAYFTSNSSSKIDESSSLSTSFKYDSTQTMSHTTSLDDMHLTTYRSDLADTIVRSSTESVETSIGSSLYHDPVTISSSQLTESMSHSHYSSNLYYPSPYVSESNVNHDSTTIISDYSSYSTIITTIRLDSSTYSTIIASTSVLSAMVLSDSFSDESKLYVSTYSFDTTILPSSMVLTGSLFDTGFSTDISTSDNQISSSASISSRDMIALSTLALHSSSTNIVSNEFMITMNGMHGSDVDITSDISANTLTNSMVKLGSDAYYTKYILEWSSSNGSIDDPNTLTTVVSADISFSFDRSDIQYFSTIDTNNVYLSTSSITSIESHLISERLMLPTSYSSSHFETLLHDSYHINYTTEGLALEPSYISSSVEEYRPEIYSTSLQFGVSSTTNRQTTAELTSSERMPLDIEISLHVSSCTNLTTVSTEFQLLPSTSTEYIFGSISDSSAGNWLSEVPGSLGSHVTNKKYSTSVVSLNISEDNTLNILSVLIDKSSPFYSLPVSVDANHAFSTTIVPQDVSYMTNLPSYSLTSLSTSTPLESAISGSLKTLTTSTLSGNTEKTIYSLKTSNATELHIDTSSIVLVTITGNLQMSESLTHTSVQLINVSRANETLGTMNDPFSDVFGGSALLSGLSLMDSIELSPSKVADELTFAIESTSTVFPHLSLSNTYLSVSSNYSEELYTTIALVESDSMLTVPLRTSEFLTNFGTLHAPTVRSSNVGFSYLLPVFVTESTSVPLESSYFLLQTSENSRTINSLMPIVYSSNYIEQSTLAFSLTDHITSEVIFHSQTYAPPIISDTLASQETKSSINGGKEESQRVVYLTAIESTNSLDVSLTLKSLYLSENVHVYENTSTYIDIEHTSSVLPPSDIHESEFDVTGVDSSSWSATMFPEEQVFQRTEIEISSKETLDTLDDITMITSYSNTPIYSEQGRSMLPTTTIVQNNIGVSNILSLSGFEYPSNIISNVMEDITASFVETRSASDVASMTNIDGTRSFDSDFPTLVTSYSDIDLATVYEPASFFNTSSLNMLNAFTETSHVERVDNMPTVLYQSQSTLSNVSSVYSKNMNSSVYSKKIQTSTIDTSIPSSTTEVVTNSIPFSDRDTYFSAKSSLPSFSQIYSDSFQRRTHPTLSLNSGIADQTYSSTEVFDTTNTFNSQAEHSVSSWLPGYMQDTSIPLKSTNSIFIKDPIPNTQL